MFSKAERKNGIYTVFSIWNCFKMVFAPARKLQKRLICFCICLEKASSEKTANFAQVGAQGFTKKNRTRAVLGSETSTGS